MNTKFEYKRLFFQIMNITDNVQLFNTYQEWMTNFSTIASYIVEVKSGCNHLLQTHN